MRVGWALWAGVVFLVLLHFLLHLGFGLGRIAPDLLTIALLVASREVGMGIAGGIGFFFGLLEDAFSVLAFGANAVTLTVVGILGARTRDLFVGDSQIFIVSYLGLGKLLRDVIHWVVAGEAVREPFMHAIVVHFAPSAVYAAIVGIVAMKALEALGGLSR
jgi:rod shape-determining protein MreD